MCYLYPFERAAIDCIILKSKPIFDIDSIATGFRGGYRGGSGFRGRGGGFRGGRGRGGGLVPLPFLIQPSRRNLAWIIARKPLTIEGYLRPRQQEPGKWPKMQNFSKKS